MKCVRLLLEHDIISLRANLHSISQNISAHKWQPEEIENYLNGELDEEVRSMMENEALVNTNLADDIKLYNEIRRGYMEKRISCR